MHDPRVGRFLSIDPLVAEYPWNSPYAFAENKVIQFVELEGLECGQGASTPPEKPNGDPLTNALVGAWNSFTSDDVPTQEKINAVIPDKLGTVALKGISLLPQAKKLDMQVDLSGWGGREWGEAAQEAVGLGAGFLAGTSARTANAANAGWRVPMKAPTKLPKSAPVQTRRGPAGQAMTPEAIAARGSVENGALLYRQGNLGVQNTADAQFWSPYKPYHNAQLRPEFGSAWCIQLRSKPDDDWST